MSGAMSCPECKFSGSPGLHWIEPDDATRQPYSIPCPTKAATLAAQEQEETARRIVATEHTAARDAARQIVHDAAQRLTELSANDCRDEIKAAQLEGRSGLMGAAFSYAARQGWIEWTGHMVVSTDPETKGHRIMLYRSLVRDGSRAEAS